MSMRRLLLLWKRRFIQSVRAESVEAFANLLTHRERLSTTSMRTGFIGVSLIVLAALAGCKPGDNAPAVAVGADPHLQAQQEMEKGGMDFSHVVVVRLQSEGKRVEVTSILPAVIAEAQVAGQPAKTIFRVNEAGNALVMFSRDAPHGTSNRTEVSFTELERKKVVVFPVVAADGSLKEREFALEKIVALQ